MLAKLGEGPSIQITPGRYFRETMLITLLNPKAIMFYLAFFPQFIDPINHQGWVTFAVMALTIAVLGFVYCLGVVLITHNMAERPIGIIFDIARKMERAAGLDDAGEVLRTLGGEGLHGGYPFEGGGGGVG